MEFTKKIKVPDGGSPNLTWEFDFLVNSLALHQKHLCIFLGSILPIWIFWKTLILVYHGFRSKKGEIYFGTNFAHLDILENFDSISMSCILVKKGGNSFSDQFCPFGYFEKL